MIWSFFSANNEVYLTFDDGPNEEITPYILDRLHELGWKATFFCVGENAEKYPHLIQRITNEGHAIGNHTMRHENAWKTAPINYLQSIDKASSVIPSKLFRPPYGKISRRLMKELTKQKFKIIMWSFMAYDFDTTIAHSLVQKKAKKHLQPGSIIVLHDNEKFIDNEKKVFDLLVTILQEKELHSIKIV